MERIEAALILFGILFISVFLIDYIFIKRKYIKKINSKKKKKKSSELTEITYLISKFKLNKQELPINGLLIVISLINAFIISLVAIVVMLIDIYVIFQLIIGFILLIALIYSIYELLGRYLVKRGFGSSGK